MNKPEYLKNTSSYLANLYRALWFNERGLVDRGIATDQVQGRIQELRFQRLQIKAELEERGVVLNDVE